MASYNATRRSNRRAPDARLKRESDKLEEEASKMEQKLRNLKQQMEQEKAKRENERPLIGGSRWKSGNAQRGSLRNYSTEVRERPMNRRGSGRGSGHAKSGGVSASPLKSKTQKERETKQPHEEYMPRNPNAWTLDEVIRWLGKMELKQYTQTFIDNEISGSVLLEVGSEDLDYMNIKVLAHRKKLLKGIESLRRGGDGLATPRGNAGQGGPSKVHAYGNGSNENLPPPVRMNDPFLHLQSEHESKPKMKVSSGVNTGNDSESHQDSISSTQYVSVGNKNDSSRSKHWSQVAPLSQNEVSGSGSVPVNLADGEYDEAANQRAFQEAVMEWRSSGGKTIQNGKSTLATGSSGGFSIGATQATEDSSQWKNPWGTDEGPETSSTDVTPTAGGGGKLLEGFVDEDAEHEAFRRAVEAWRRGEDVVDVNAGVKTATASTSTNSGKPPSNFSIRGKRSQKNQNASENDPNRSNNEDKITLKDWMDSLDKQNDERTSLQRQIEAEKKELEAKQAELKDRIASIDDADHESSTFGDNDPYTSDSEGSLTYVQSKVGVAELARLSTPLIQEVPDDVDISAYQYNESTNYTVESGDDEDDKADIWTTEIHY